LCPSTGLDEDVIPDISINSVVFFPSGKAPIVLKECRDALFVIDEQKHLVRCRLTSGAVLSWIRSDAFRAPTQWDMSRTLRDSIREFYHGPDSAKLSDMLRSGGSAGPTHGPTSR